MHLDKTVAHRWFIKLRDETVGTVSLSEINTMMGTAEIRKLTASVAEQNVASIRVLEKAIVVFEEITIEDRIEGLPKLFRFKNRLENDRTVAEKRTQVYKEEILPVIEKYFTAREIISLYS